MLTSLLILLLISNALTSRKDKSILFSRVVILGLVSTSYLAWNNFFVKPLGFGLGIYGGLFNVTSFSQTLHICIFMFSAVILTLTAFYPSRLFSYHKANLFMLGLGISAILISIPLKTIFKILTLEFGLGVYFHLFTVGFIGILSFSIIRAGSNRALSLYGILSAFLYSVFITGSIIYITQHILYPHITYVADVVSSAIVLLLNYDLAILTSGQKFQMTGDYIKPYINHITQIDQDGKRREVPPFLSNYKPDSGLSFAEWGIVRNRFSAQLANITYSINGKCIDLNNLNLRFERYFDKAKEAIEAGDRESYYTHALLARQTRFDIRNIKMSVEADIASRHGIAVRAQTTLRTSALNAFEDPKARADQISTLAISNVYVNDNRWNI